MCVRLTRGRVSELKTTNKMWDLNINGIRGIGSKELLLNADELNSAALLEMQISLKQYEHSNMFEDLKKDSIRKHAMDELRSDLSYVHPMPTPTSIVHDVPASVRATYSELFDTESDMKLFFKSDLDESEHTSTTHHCSDAASRIRNLNI